MSRNGYKGINLRQHDIKQENNIFAFIYLLEEKDLSRLRLSVKPKSTHWDTYAPLENNTGSTQVHKITLVDDSSFLYKLFWGNTKGFQIQPSRPESRRVRISLEEGIVRGVSTTLDLDLDDSLLRSKFGERVTVNPTHKATDIVFPGQKQNVYGPRVVPDSCCVTVTSSLKEMKGVFECTAVLNGVVLIKYSAGGSAQFSIGTIISDLQQARALPADIHKELLKLNVVGDTVEFKMAGKAVFKWEINSMISLS